MEISDWVFSDLYPIENDEMLTDISGLKLKKKADGTLSLIQNGDEIVQLKRLAEHNLKPLKLLLKNQFQMAKAAYQKLHKQHPELMSIRGNSLGILASHLRARHKSTKLYEQLRDIAISIYGEPIVSWDVDDIGI
jgi:hypothetical protein